jgi:aminoglycoside/choline kinase family phosphotransferase
MRRFESGYFRDAFLKNHLGLKDSWPELEGPFSHLADTASRAEAAFLLHRDFQSRNIMLPGSRVGVIDWQGARIGPLGYDLASLLIDPYVGLTPGCADCVFRTYREHLRNYDTTRVDPFRRLYPYLAVQRNLQMLGAFAHLSRKMGKTTFEAYIPPAVASLRSLLTGLGDPALQALRELAERLAEDCKPVEGRERREG